MNPTDKSGISRRDFVSMAVGGIAATSLISVAPLSIIPESPHQIKAIAFDAFPIFDPRPIFTLVNTLFPEKGTELGNTWKAKQFEYTWLRTAAGQYKNFWEVTEDALEYAAAKTGIVLKGDQRKQLMDTYLNLNIWPDVLPALDALKNQGIRLAFLSNFTPDMLNACIKTAKLEGYFERVLSTDMAQTYKPSHAAYQLGVDTLRLKKEEMVFAAFAGWDAVGAKWFGYPTFWVNRQNLAAEELGAKADGIGKNLDDLVAFVKHQ